MRNRLNRYRYRLLRQFAPLQTLKVNGFKLTVDLRDEVMAYLLYTTGQYEQHLLDFISKISIDGAVAVDIGANFGLYSTALSRAVGSKGQVISFEPEPYNFALLQKNLKQNSIANCNAQMYAVGNKHEVSFIQLSTKNFGDHFVTATNTGRSVEIVKLDDSFHELKVTEKVKYIKVDVQGFELKVLEGATRSLLSSDDILVQIELQPCCLERQETRASQVVELLYSLGYTGFEIHPNRIIPMSAANAYDFILDNSSVDCILSRDGKHLANCLSKANGIKI